MGNHARPSRRDLAIQVDDHTLGKVVGRHLILQRQLLQLGGQIPVTADDLAHQAFLSQVIQTAFFTVPLTCCVN